MRYKIMKILTVFRVASAALLFACMPALAQNPGTVTNHAFTLGKGVGTGFGSLVCTGFAVGTGAGADPTCRSILAGDLPLGTSVLNPGTGTLEAVLPIQTVTGASKSFLTADLFKETRRFNSGSAMSDTFPASSATGLVNGTKITVVNVDATVNDTITAGAGTTISGTGIVGPGRAIQYVYDAPTTTWRPTLNTGTALLGPNNLSDLTSSITARANLGLGTAAVHNTGTSGDNVPLLNGINTWGAAQTFSDITVNGSLITTHVTLTNEGVGGGTYQSKNAAGTVKDILSVSNTSFATDTTNLISAGGGITFQKADRTILGTLSNAGALSSTIFVAANEGSNGSFAALNNVGTAKALLTLSSTSLGANVLRLRSPADGIQFEKSDSSVMGFFSEANGSFTVALPTAVTASPANAPIGLNVLAGASGARISASNTPAVTISKYESINLGGANDGSDGPALYVLNNSTGSSQNVGVSSKVSTTGDTDTVALYGAAIQNHPTSTRAAFGGFFTVGAFGANSSGIAIETNTANWTGKNAPYTPASLFTGQIFIGIDNGYDGNTSGEYGGIAMLIRATRPPGQWDVGVAAPSGNHVHSSFLQDDSNSPTSFYVHGGSHTDGVRLDGGTYSGCAIKGTSFCLNGSGSITSGVWSATTIAAAAGGTGQSSYTLGDTLYASGASALSKLAGNTTTAKQYLSQTGNGTISAAPAWATIAGSDITGAALTKTDDTNVTLTLGGTPASALLQATSITVGWTGTLANSRLATMATNTIKGNATSGTASPTDLAIGSCDTATKALQWTTNTGFGCNSSITAADVANAPVIAKVLTGYASGAGTVSAADSILSAIQKLNGNDALKLPLAGGTMAGAIAMGGNNITGGGTGSFTTLTGTGGSHTGLTGLGIRDTSAAFDVTVAATSTSATLTAGRVLTLDMGNVAHTLKFGTTANTITFPNVASDTVAMLGATQTLSAVNTFSNATASTNATSGAVVITGGLGVNGAVFTGSNISAAGNIAGTNLVSVSGAGPELRVIDTGTGTASFNFYASSSTQQYQFGNQTGAFFLYDVVNARYVVRMNATSNTLELASGGTINTNIGTSGSTNTLNGSTKLANIPASAGAGGLNVCVDTSGVLYKKASCP